MSVNQPSKNEQAARHFLRSHGIAGNLMVRPLLDLLDRTEAEAVALPINDWLANFNLDTASLVDRLHELERLRAQVAELERERNEARAIANRHYQAEHSFASQLAASRIEAKRLREALETLAVETVHFNSAAHHECRICGRSSPHGAPPIAHLETCALAATSESAAAWLAEVQRKALERGKE